MKIVLVSTAAIVGIVLAGCSQRSPDVNSPHHGRYLGVGIYSPGPLWSKMVADRRGVTASANTRDDEQVIVVVDSDTGEIRQCGNLSGYCVGMNPWRQPLTASQTAPISLTAHAASEPAEAGNVTTPSGR